MKILIIDNNIDPDSWGSVSLCRLARIVPDATIYVRRAPQEDLPKNPKFFDRIVISGSKTSAIDDAPWIEKLFEFIRQTVEAKVPLLGVCYGHQALNRALGSKENVRIAASSEFGWTKIQVTEPGTLFRGMPQEFYSFSAHYDEVSILPQGMKKLAFSELCHIQACQLENRPVFGIQFHPEKDLADAERLFSRLKLATQNQKPKKSKQLIVPTPNILNSTRSKELYDQKIGDTLFTNFINI